jgi:hypothetical protein
MATSEEAPAPSAEPVLAEEEALTDEEAKIQGLAKTLEEKIAAHGERAIECGPAYVEYARALLAKSQAESDPLGGAIKREDAGAQPSGAGTSSGAADEDADDAEEGGEEGGEEGEAEGDDLELAFQCLEVARLIYEEVRTPRPSLTHALSGPLRRPCRSTAGAPARAGVCPFCCGRAGDDAGGACWRGTLTRACTYACVRALLQAVPAQLLPLSGVLECLGDVAMENEMWDEAIDDLTRCLELKKQLYAADDRELAHTHYQLATAALASMEKCRQDAAQPPPPPLPGTDPPPTAEESAALVQRYQKQVRQTRATRACGVCSASRACARTPPACVRSPPRVARAYTNAARARRAATERWTVTRL